MKFLTLLFTFSFLIPAFSQSSIPVIDTFEVMYNGEVTEERSFNVGNTVILKITATDPNERPLQYIYRRYRKNIYTNTIMDWSDVSMMPYTFTSNDVVGGFSIVLGIKNDDGVDNDGFFGDVQMGVSFTVSE